MKNYVIYFIIVFGVMSKGCITIEKAKTIAYKNPNQFADVCATLFPVKETTKEVIKYVPAENKDYTPQINAAISERDSAINELQKLKDIAAKDKTVNCIHYKEQIPKLGLTISRLSATIQRLKDEYEKCKSDTLFNTRTSIQEDLAKYIALNEKYIQLGKDYAVMENKASDANKKANRWMWSFIVLFTLGTVYGFLKFKRIL